MAGLLYSISIFFFLMLKTKQKKIILFLLMVQVIFIMEIFSGRFRKDQKKQNKFLNQKIVLLKIVKIMRMILKKRMTKKQKMIMRIKIMKKRTMKMVRMKMKKRRKKKMLKKKRKKKNKTLIFIIQQIILVVVGKKQLIQGVLILFNYKIQTCQEEYHKTDQLVQQISILWKASMMIASRTKVYPILIQSKNYKN